MFRLLQKIISPKYKNIFKHIKQHPDIIMKVRMFINTYGFRIAIKRIIETVYAATKEVKQLEIIPPKKNDDSNFIVKNVTTVTTALKIAVVIHAFHLDKISVLLEQIHHIPYPFKLYVTVAPEKRKELEKILNLEVLNFEVIVCKNEGYDIVPFISILPLLLEENYDLVCKLHTKKGAAHLEQHIIGIEDLWFNLLLDPLVGGEQTVKKVINAFELERSLGMVNPADLYKSAQKLMYGNEASVSAIISTLDSDADPAQNWNFVAGSMFWARLEVLRPLSDNSKLNDLLNHSSDMQTGDEISSFHAMERVFGLLPQLSQMKNALSYAVDLKRTSHAIAIISDNNATYNYLGVGNTLQNEHTLVENYRTLQNRKEFDQQYYLENTPVAAKLCMDPLLHFLRYGVYQNSPPSPEFSPFAYLSLYRNVLLGRLNPLIHYLSSHQQKKNTILPAEVNTEIAIRIIKDSNMFDKSYYKKENKDVVNATDSPLHHYCQYGWLENRRPSHKFDSLWYKNKYLNLFILPINPLLHYVLIGKDKGFKTQPEPHKDATQLGTALPVKHTRICLFAAYDPDGLIDDSVVLFVKELAQYSDVYFLSDTTLHPSELDRVGPYTKGAWGVRHGEYDFGSYLRLAQYYIGWDVIEKYDEVLLVNDSSYLLRSLADLFKTMNQKRCCWWGLQATKGMAATKHIKSNQFEEKIPISTVKLNMLAAFAKDDIYDFHIGSYFIAFRKEIILDGELKRFLSQVTKEKDKKSIIIKYEFGLTRRLIEKGYNFATFVEHLYPFHPLYTDNIFTMIKEDDYPLFKRFLLTENHYNIPELWRWKDKLRRLLPQLDLAPITKNLFRVANAEKLHHNLNITKKTAKLLNYREIRRLDKKYSPQNNYWVFPVCAYDHTLSGNERAVFEEVKYNPAITKVILTRSKYVDLHGVNVCVSPLKSLEGQQHLLKADIIFIKHTPKENVPYPLDPKRHKFVNLWHGIPLKRIGAAALDLQSKLNIISREHEKCHCVIASSAIDRMAMATAFHPLTYSDIWVTGLPRNDFILRPESQLPEDLRSQTRKIDQFIAGKKFILFAPTFRKSQNEAYFKFSYKDKINLFAYLTTNNIILGIREHMADKTHSYSSDLKNHAVIDVGRTLFPNIEVLYRRADLLITDYSSCFIDFMLTGKPMISFAYDYEQYKTKERGLFYDLEFVFPGPICHDFDSLLREIKTNMKQKTITPTESYLFKRQIFFDHIDSHNAKRLVAKILET